MADSIKIASIGGGSSYTPELIEGFIKRYDNLPVKELWLVDIEEGKRKLDIIVDMAKRMVLKAGIDMKVYGTLDRKEALKGADFVITQFRVGQLDAREKDELIPLKYGVIGQETNGPGGMFKALRTIPVLLDIIKDCEKLCPNAWIISFTNPAGLNAETILRYTGWKKFIGLCNSPMTMTKRVAKLMGLNREDVRLDFAGLNHMVFGLKTYYKGEDISDKVIETLANYNEGKSFEERYETLSYTSGFVRELNCIPSPYLRYYFAMDEMFKDASKSAEGGKSRAQFVKKAEKELFEIYSKPEVNEKPIQLELRGGAYYSDAACNLVDSIYNDKCDIQVVNTLNNGACSSFSDDEVVEISSVITKEGPKPIAVGRLPIQVEGLCRQIKTYERMTAKAAITGNKETAIYALTINPFVQDETKARAIFEEMYEAHKKYLPEFK